MVTVKGVSDLHHHLGNLLIKKGNTNTIQRACSGKELDVAEVKEGREGG